MLAVKRFIIHIFMIFQLIFLLSTSLVWAENTTTLDQSAEQVVVKQILDTQKNKESSSAQSPNTELSNKNISVQNDLAEGQIRELPSLTAPVVDQAHILSIEEKQAIEQKLSVIYKQAKAQIGVVIVPTTGQEDIFDYSMRVAEAWKLGSAKNDNGILITVVINDRRIQIVTGYGLEGILPDIVLNRIIRQYISPEFKEGQLAQGLMSGIVQIENILNMDPDVAEQSATELKERQEQALLEKEGRERIFEGTLIILLVGIVASYAIGNRLSATLAGCVGMIMGLINGIGILSSILLGFGIFFLLITAIAHTLFKIILSALSKGGGSGGGSSGGGGYRGGGGRFGGGGASGSW
ncbi:TPM domain-containing protein [Acinetobacter equi]|nr:TPM domain-containing protein [Acinetobacter equi]